MDFARTIEALREVRETTCHAAAVPGAAGKRMKPVADSVKKAKEGEYKSEPAGIEEEMTAKKISKK